MAADIFLHFASPDLKGESTDTQLKDQIELMSWSWGESQSGSHRGTSGAAAGRVDMQDLSVTKLVDKSSPQLMLKCALGQHFGKVTLSVRKAVGDKKSQQ